jgi:hypothetical protein
LARRARSRLAPTRWDDSSPVGYWCLAVGRSPPSCRGQALPDPPARRAGISPRTPVAGRSGSSPHAGMGRACAAPCGTRGRGSASPLQTRRGASPVRHMGATGRCNPRPVGVRRCLTRPARQGRQTIPSPFVRCAIPNGRRVPVCAAGDRAWWRGRARPRLAPTGVWRSIPGRATVRHGSPQPPCRGQALPDPSGPPGPADHRGHPSAVGGDHRGMPGGVPHVPRLWRGRARQRLAPTPWANPPPVGHWSATGGCNPRLVGVRRCLTRPARQGRHSTAEASRRSVAIIAAPWHATRTCPRPWRGRARQRLAPTAWDNPSPVGHWCLTVGRSPP